MWNAWQHYGMHRMKKSDTYQRLDRVTVINRLKVAGYVDAAEFLEGKMR